MNGPGAPYTLLFDEDDAVGPGLPEAVRAIYGGDWPMPAAPPERPYTFTNFVVSHDGRITFDEPGYAGGGDVSRGAPHDTWLMALLRSRADAILTGGATLRSAGNHRWTPWATFPIGDCRCLYAKPYPKLRIDRLQSRPSKKSSSTMMQYWNVPMLSVVRHLSF